MHRGGRHGWWWRPLHTCGCFARSLVSFWTFVLLPDASPGAAQSEKPVPFTSSRYALNYTYHNLSFVPPVLGPYQSLSSSCPINSSWTERWIPNAVAFSESLMPSRGVSHDFVDMFYGILRKLRIRDIGVLDAITVVLEHPECERLRLFGYMMYLPMIGMPVTGATVFLCRYKLGWCGARYQPYDVTFYRATWMLLSGLLSLVILTMLASTLITFVATYGFTYGLKEFANKTEELLMDLETAAENVRIVLVDVKGYALEYAKCHIDGHFDSIGELINDAVWLKLDSLTRSGIQNLGLMMFEPEYVRDSLININQRLSNVTNNTKDSQSFLVKIQQDLREFIQNCTTPYFCDRIDIHGLDIALETSALVVDREESAARNITIAQFPAEVAKAVKRFNRTGTAIMDVSTGILREARYKVANWSARVVRIIEPILDIDKPTIDTVKQARTKFRDIPGHMGWSVAQVQYLFFGFGVVMASVVLLWVTGSFCAVGNYEPISHPSSRTLDSDFAGLFLMSVTYISYALAFVAIWIGINIVVGATVSNAVLCSVLKNGTYPAKEVDTLINGLLGDYEPIIADTNEKTAISMGAILEFCADPLEKHSLLELLSFHSQGGSKVYNQSESLSHHSKEILNVTKHAGLNETLVHLLNATQEERKLPIFSARFLELLAAYQGNLTTMNLVEPRKQLQNSLTKIPMDDYLKEMGKISHGLVSKEWEQRIVNETIRSITTVLNERFGSNAKFQLSTLKEIEAFEKNLTHWERTPKRFSENRQSIQAFADAYLDAAIYEVTKLFNSRVVNYTQRYANYSGEGVLMNRVRECDPIKNAIDNFSALICDCVIGHMILLGFTLIVASLAFLPACTLAIFLSRQLTILPQSDHVEDHYERGIPPEFRKRPHRKQYE